MIQLPSVVRAESRGEHSIELVFNDGLCAEVDFADWLHGPMFEPLKDLTYFKRYFVEAGAIVWPNGADIAPVTLYERARSTTAA